MRKSKKKITDISVKDVKNYFKDERYKIKKKVDSYLELPELMFSEMNPVFVVSTGRSGSELLVRLMNESKIGTVYHEPRPRMFYGSKLLFESNIILTISTTSKIFIKPSLLVSIVRHSSSQSCSAVITKL